MDPRTALARARKNPALALKAGRALARGYYYRLKFRLLRKRVIIGKRFRVVGPLDIRGPGTVIFGDDCIVVSSRMARCTPYTHAKDAVLRFGNGVIMAGTRLGCQGLIEIGDAAEISDARIMDTDFHQTDTTGFRANTSGTPRAVRIGAHTWIGAGAFILKGAVIGEGSVVGAAAVVAQEVPPHVVVAGNPARVVRQLKSHLAVPADQANGTNEPAPPRRSEPSAPAPAV